MLRRKFRTVALVLTALLTTYVCAFLLSNPSNAPTSLPSRSRPRDDCKTWKESPQHKTTLKTKTSCARNYFLLVLVSSAPANQDRRNLIRQTWGTDDNVPPMWKTYFLIAQTENQTHSGLVKKEDEAYGDLIRADYYENYWKQSFKIMMAFEWASRYCKFSYIMKADDDILVNTADLIKFLLKKSTPEKNLFLGRLHHNPAVRREGKWKVSYEEYNHTHYPDFCSGAGFVMTYDVIECIVPLFDVIKPYRMDDVYVGMLAHAIGVIAVDHRGFFMPFDGYDDYSPEFCLPHSKWKKEIRSRVSNFKGTTLAASEGASLLP
ncbi:Lactosylceramide 1,3-N-acetyl-beta-D-glucosaminyltransferase [Stylophora pistillata]|uniref:Hexosyltransferase n=1 Tax=Stylophora pistillata TaxID=50429 RepID=A0A2B4RG85_STYPI|nr:Lactosylceramide 1,3-N-acetyl-beta-D-glucosaminyltransferase [Stylophora pistillata]